MSVRKKLSMLKSFKSVCVLDWKRVNKKEMEMVGKYQREIMKGRGRVMVCVYNSESE